MTIKKYLFSLSMLSPALSAIFRLAICGILLGSVVISSSWAMENDNDLASVAYHPHISRLLEQEMVEIKPYVLTLNFSQSIDSMLGATPTAVEGPPTAFRRFRLAEVQEEFFNTLVHHTVQGLYIDPLIVSSNEIGRIIRDIAKLSLRKKGNLKAFSFPQSNFEEGDPLIFIKNTTNPHDELKEFSDEIIKEIINDKKFLKKYSNIDTSNIQGFQGI